VIEPNLVSRLVYGIAFSFCADHFDSIEVSRSWFLLNLFFVDGANLDLGTMQDLICLYSALEPSVAQFSSVFPGT
jgi:hypothetical protein